MHAPLIIAVAGAVLYVPPPISTFQFTQWNSSLVDYLIESDLDLIS